MAGYYILVDNVQQGPFPTEKLKEKGVTAETYVWRKGLPHWVKARDEPELQGYIPWQPPSRQSPEESKTAAVSSPQSAKPATDLSGAASSVLENAQKEESDSAASAKAKKKKAARNNASLASRWEDLKDWFLLLDPLHQKILAGMAVSAVVVPLLIWGISMLGGHSGPKYPVIKRSGDNDLNQLVQRGKKEPPQKAVPEKRPAPKEIGKKQAAVADNRKESPLPPGRLTEEYYRLVRYLSFDRLLRRQESQVFLRTGSQPSARRTPEEIIDHYHQLAETAKDETFRRLARRAALLWETVQKKSNGNRVGISGFRRGGFGVAGSPQREKEKLRPDLLYHRLQGRHITPDDYHLEQTHEDLWDETIRHMQSALDRAAPLTPALARLTDHRRGTFGISSGQLQMENTSGETLYHVTLRLKLETPWGASVTRYFYRDKWTEKTFWMLPAGNLWGQEGLRQTTIATLTVWSDNGVMPPREFPFADRLAAVIQQLENFCREELSCGYYEVPELIAAGLKQHRQVLQSGRHKAEQLQRRARRLKKNHLALIAATSPERTYIGIWRFGKYEGELAIEFLAPKDSVPRNQGQSWMASAAAPRKPARRTAVSARWFHPESPTEYKIYEGAVEYDPQADAFLLFLSGRSTGPGLDGTTTRLPDTSRNYLLKKEQRTFVFTLQEDILWGAAERGDTFCFTPLKKDDDWKKQLTTWKQKSAALQPPEILSAGVMLTVQPALDEEFLPVTTPSDPWPLPWSPGEIRRFDVSPHVQSAARPVEQVFFSRKGSTVYGVAGGITVGWQTASGNEKMWSRTGQPVVFVPSRQWLLVPGGRGIRVYDARQGSSLRGSRFQFSGATGVLSLAENGRRFISGSADGTLTVWDLSGKVVMRGKHNTAVTAVALNADGTLAASATEDQRLTVWKVQEKNNYVRSFGSGTMPIASLRFSDDGRRLLTISTAANVSASFLQKGQQKGLNRAGDSQGQKKFREDGLQIFSVETGQKQAALRVAGPVTALAVSADWRWALLGTPDGPVVLWNLQRGEKAGRLVGHIRPARSLCFSDDMRFALSGGEDGAVILWGLPLTPAGPAVKPRVNNSSSFVIPGKTAQEPVISTPPQTAEERKRAVALKKVQLARAAAQAGRRVRASEFLKEAADIAGKDPLVRQAMEKVRMILGTN